MYTCLISVILLPLIFMAFKYNVFAYMSQNIFFHPYVFILSFSSLVESCNIWWYIFFFPFSICFCWCAIAVVSYAIHHCTLIISPSLFIFTGTYQTVQDKMASFLTDTFIVRSASKKSREMRWNCQMIPLNLSRKFTHHFSPSLVIFNEY